MSTFIILETRFAYGELYSPSVIAKENDSIKAQQAMEDRIKEMKKDRIKDMSPFDLKEYHENYEDEESIEPGAATLKFNDEWFDYLIIEV